MLNLLYPALKKRLNNYVMPKYTDWYMGQYLEDEAEEGGNLLWDTPAVFVETAPVQWQTMGGNIQSANLQFAVHLVTDALFDDDKRITDPVLQHFLLDSKVYKGLQNWRCMLSYVPGLEALAGTDGDRVLIESVVRTDSEPDHTLRRQMVAINRFSCRIYDYTAAKEWETVMAQLELSIIKVNSL